MIVIRSKKTKCCPVYWKNCVYLVWKVSFVKHFCSIWKEKKQLNQFFKFKLRYLPSQQIAMLAQIFFLFVEIGADDRCNPFLSSPVTHFYICRYLSRMVPKMTKIIYAATHLYICTYLSRTVTLTVDSPPPTPQLGSLHSEHS